jgi:hypothetical protein
MAKEKKEHLKNVPPTKAPIGFKKPPTQWQFKKGVNHNPLNLKKPKTVRAMENLTENALQSLISDVMTKTRPELENMLRDPNIPLAHSIVIKTALKADKDMSFHQFNEILNRAIGVVKQKVDHSSEDGSMSPAQSVNFYIPENKREDEKP